jgi:DDE superfamily endonuclease
VGEANDHELERGGRMLLFLPADIVALLAPFAPLFSRPVWRHVHVLLVGAILPPGQCLVSSALQAVGLSHLPTFQASHCVLSRAVWSSRGVSQILLQLLVGAFASEGPLVVGIDETIERRRGKRITAAGIYRDPVRSSHSHARQGARAALRLPHAAGARAVGQSGVGVALSHRTRPIQAHGPAAAPPIQIAHDLGAADDSPGASLAAGPLARGGG